ncbi:MAG: helix-turn-helix domain-containing protein [Armatimonadetes bacterium]|nr:helix-turn-helix domain-containing protein [Armatimonadota bacterium]
MKIKSVSFDNRKKGFEVKTRDDMYWFPYAKIEKPETSDDNVSDVRVDTELGSEGFTYTLESGREGTVHIEQVLEYNRDPSYVRDILLYKLTLEAQKRVKKSPLRRREITRRLNTSASQLYHLLDQTNYRKSIDQMLALLNILDCEVDLVVRAKSA